MANSRKFSFNFFLSLPLIYSFFTYSNGADQMIQRMGNGVSESGREWKWRMFAASPDGSSISMHLDFSNWASSQHHHHFMNATQNHTCECHWGIRKSIPSINYMFIEIKPPNTTKKNFAFDNNIYFAILYMFPVQIFSVYSILMNFIVSYIQHSNVQCFTMSPLCLSLLELLLLFFLVRVISLSSSLFVPAANEISSCFVEM